MSKACLVITAVVVEKRPVAEVVATHGVSRSRLYELLARYRDEGEAAFEPPLQGPEDLAGSDTPATVDLVLMLRKQLLEAGHDKGVQGPRAINAFGPRTWK